jgi:hypothetical protein
VEHLRANTGRDDGLEADRGEAEADAQDEEGAAAECDEQGQWPGDDEEDGEEEECDHQ